MLKLPASAVFTCLAATSLSAQTPAPPQSPAAKATEYVEVTATRIPEDVTEVPLSMDVVSARELRDWGATDLRDALGLLAGVEIAPGGDAGPAGSVPEIWGLREFDAFLLVVDGVPWGSTFAPDMATLDLADVDRIELVRGSAPVMYGATAFSGVIHVVRRTAADSRGSVGAWGGNHGSGGGSLAVSLPKWAGWESSLALAGGHQGFRDDRTDWSRGHLLWRNRRQSSRGLWRFDVDLTLLDQSPGSPHPREGQTLSPLVPLDANHNPADSFLDRRRYMTAVGYDRQTSGGLFSTTLSYTRSTSDARRGFLTSVSGDDPNAIGFEQQIGVNELYFDSHLEWTRSARTRVVAGVDWLHGNGESTGSVFDYLVSLHGQDPPPARLDEAVPQAADDRRDFFGAYGFAEWNPSSRWRLEAGLRLNVTNEAREGEAGAEAPGATEPTRTDVRPSGSLGVVWTAWSGGQQWVRLFADYRNTFKPAVFDFGLGEGEEEEGLLKPETAQSYELGARGHLLDGRLSLELAGFWMDFSNLVVANSVGGLPALQNAGTERFKGFEGSLRWRVRDGLSLRAAVSYHDSRFRDFVRDFDGVPTQLGGNRLEMAPHLLASGGLVWARQRGPLAQVSVQHVGSRFLNMRNTALAGSYATVSAGLGWREKRWELRLDGKNLNDTRPPVSESELGDAQYYLLPARQVNASLNVRF